MILYIFNPENDLALADGGANYCPPPAAALIADELATLPLWFAEEWDCVLLPGDKHCEYYNKVSEVFDVAMPFSNNMRDNVTFCSPWGWSPQIKRRLRVMGFENLLPSDDSISAIRDISNRRSSIRILSFLKDNGVDIPPMPRYFTQTTDVAEFVNGHRRCVVKAPWSGSGKGIAWGIGRVEPPMEHFYKGVIRRQGGVVCEEFLDCKVEFAMEFFADGNEVSFAGYSLFKSFKGSYSGNVLATDDDIENFLAQYICINELVRVKRLLPNVLSSLLSSSGYKGYLGVDMMIYQDECSVRLNPCMELNLRMNMGMVARKFFDKHVSSRCNGEYRVSFFKNRGEAYMTHLADKERYPLVVDNGRISSGYLNLSPITEDSRYSASVIIYKDKGIEQIYNG
ncbi:MAG: hypothetical protein IKJ97_04980 [Bacteroidaceae bacterium]|nr:hypothetical protein [Bacteroidaceae bacterium]